MSTQENAPLFSTNPLLSGIEKLLKRQLQASTAARTRLKKLSGKILALELDGIGINLFVECREDDIGLHTHFTEEADVIISGTPLAMLAFTRAQDQGGIRGGSVKFTGDVGVAQDFQKLFAVLSPDFEEELSRLIGDEAAFRVSSTIKNLFSRGREAASQLGTSLSIMMTEQRRDTPKSQELEAFLDNVDKIRADVDRAAARVDQLATLVTTRAGGQPDTEN